MRRRNIEAPFVQISKNAKIFECGILVAIVLTVFAFAVCSVGPMITGDSLPEATKAITE